MSEHNTATGGATAESEPRPGEGAELIDVRAVARLLSCSTRHVYRLADSGAMPRPLKLGALIRWRRDEVTAWIARGCPAVRTGKAVRP